mgnify:CR=1 FL=1
MIQLKQKAKYNFVLGLKLEDVWKEYSDYMRLTEWKRFYLQCELLYLQETY